MPDLVIGWNEVQSPAGNNWEISRNRIGSLPTVTNQLVIDISPWQLVMTRGATTFYVIFYSLSIKYKCIYIYIQIRISRSIALYLPGVRRSYNIMPDDNNCTVEGHGNRRTKTTFHAVVKFCSDGYERGQISVRCCQFNNWHL